ncbi:MAG: hypothetical protein KKB03_02195, partial [Nanoarchaeota archaeon]|nr:hypothetical protein [Nanoarchaeota archaeon]
AIIAILIILGCIGISTIGEGWFPVASEDASATSITIATGEACESCSSDDCANGVCPNTKEGHPQYCTKNTGKGNDCVCEPEHYNPFDEGRTGYWCEYLSDCLKDSCYMYDDCPGTHSCDWYWDPFKRGNCKCYDGKAASECRWDNKLGRCIGEANCPDKTKCLRTEPEKCECVYFENGCGTEFNSIKEGGGDPGEDQCYIFGRVACPLDLTCIYYDTECADDYPSDPFFGGHTPNNVCRCTMPCEADMPPSQYSCGLRVPCCGNKDEYGNPDTECKTFNHFWPWDPPTQCYCEKYTL